MRGKILLLLLCGGCCFGQSGVGSPPPPPLVLPPTTTFTPDCMGLCQRTGACMDQRGQPRGDDESNCAISCALGGAYSGMPPESLACVSRATCDEFDMCTGEAIAMMLGRLLGGAPQGAAPAPPGWPDGFPVVAGGTPVAAPAAGPVRVSILAYPSTTTDDLDARYHIELAIAGWTATVSEASPRGAHRFSASRGGTTVSVSIYAEGAQTIIQTMQL